MLSLTEKIDDTFIYNDKKYNVNMAFNNIILLFEMFNDDLLDDVDKIFICIKMLVKEEIDLNSLDEAVYLYKYLLKEFLDIDTDNKEETSGKKFLDYKKDAEIIFASFYAEYKIDLTEVHDRLHWNKFIALLNNLNDKSKFKQVISIRVMEIPKANESSQEYRDHIIKMKEAYSLDDREPEEKINNTFDDLAAIFKGMK
jgi:hypothetical protein